MLAALVALSAVRGSIRFDELFGSGAGSLQAALVQAAGAAYQPLAVAGATLLVIGLMQGVLRGTDSPRDLLYHIVRICVLAGLMAFGSQPASRTLVTKAVQGLAESVSSASGGSTPLQKMGHLVELLYPAGDLKPPSGAKVAGASRAGFFDIFGQIRDKANDAIALALRNMVGFAISATAFVALYLGWLVGLLVAWLSAVLFEFGWMLVPLALGALGVEALRSIGNSYLLGLFSVGTGQLALALAHVGTDALMRWVAGALKAITNIDVDAGAMLRFPDTAFRQQFADALASLPVGALLLLLLAILVLVAWVVITPLFAWKVFMGTLQNGAQFGSRLGLAFAGAALGAAGHAAGRASAALARSVAAGNARAAEATRIAAAGGGGSPATDPARTPSVSAAAAESPLGKQSSKRPLSAKARKQVRRVLAKGVAAARKAGASDADIQQICQQLAAKAGASPAEAAELARQASLASAPPATAAQTSAQPTSSAPASSAVAVPASAAAQVSYYAPGRHAATYALAVGGVALERLGAHLAAEDGPPDPPEHDALAAALQARRRLRGETE